MTNRTNEEQEYPVKMHFVDADGFSVYESYAGDAFNKIPARSTRRLLGRALINPQNRPHSRRDSVGGQSPLVLPFPCSCLRSMGE